MQRLYWWSARVLALTICGLGIATRWPGLLGRVECSHYGYTRNARATSTLSGFNSW